MRYTAPDGRSHDIDPRFGHALVALGWTAEEPATAEPEDKKPTGRRSTKATDDK